MPARSCPRHICSVADEDKGRSILSKLPVSVTDYQVDVDVKEFFTEDGWCSVLHVLEVKRSNVKWVCYMCKVLLDDAPPVISEARLGCYHQCCENVKPTACCRGPLRYTRCGSDHEHRTSKMTRCQPCLRRQFINTAEQAKKANLSTGPQTPVVRVAGLPLLPAVMRTAL